MGVCVKQLQEGLITGQKLNEFDLNPRIPTRQLLNLQPKGCHNTADVTAW